MSERYWYIQGDYFHFGCPYEKEVLADLKLMKGGVYNPQNKEWAFKIGPRKKKEINAMVSKWKFKQKEPDASIPPQLNMYPQAHIDAVRDQIKSYGFSYEPRNYQIEWLIYSLYHEKAILADGMGCISGDAEIQIIRNKKSQKISLELLYKKFNKIGKHNRWRDGDKTYTKSFNEGSGIYIKNEIEAVLYSGKKYVVMVKLESGKSLKLTPDHKVYSVENGWVPISELNIGDKIYSNGIHKCKNCGSTDNVSTYKYAKFVGYCLKCIYREKRKNGSYKTGKTKTKDGYVVISGIFDHPRPVVKGSASVLEHILVMEKHLGRYLTKNEVIHHKNGIKDDNRLENLQLLSIKEHAKIHADENYRNLDCDSIVIIPRHDSIQSIECVGVEDTYDIVMKNPHNSFVANKVLVHNCGKTFQSILSIEVANKFPCLVITPSSVKYGFAKEWRSVTNGARSVSVIEADSNLKMGQENDWTADVIIINYDILGVWNTVKGKQVAAPRFDELYNIKWKSIICDESHFLKNSKSKRTQTVAKIIKPIQTRYFMTGTVIENRVMELWEQLKLLGTKNLITKDWVEFAYRYANAKKEYFGWKTDGSSNLMELHQKLRDNCYVRRELVHVRNDVPVEQRRIIDVDMVNRDDYEEAENDIYSYILKTKGEEAADKSQGSQESLVTESVLSELSIKGKMYAIEQYLKDWQLSTDDKLIVFGNHRFALEELAEKFGCDKIIGGVTAKEKHEIIEDWKTNKKQFLFANMISAGTGTDGIQHSCHNMLIIELPPKPSLLEQVIARIVRIGQKYPSMINFMLDLSAIDGADLDRIGGKEILTNAVNKGINNN